MITRLNITPQTNVRSTQDDKIFFRIPYNDLLPTGKARFHQLERYNEYKAACREEALRRLFIMPEGNFWVRFFVPVSDSWWNAKKYRHHLTPHKFRPDIDNFMKALKDSLMTADQRIHHYRLTKLWTNQEQGYIEIENGINIEPYGDPCILPLRPIPHLRMTGPQAGYLLHAKEELMSADDLRRKARLLRYNQYKKDVLQAAFDKGFQVSEALTWWKFFLPVPKRWSNKEKQRMHLQPHQVKPDADNLWKAPVDALLLQDSSIWDVCISKQWTNETPGHIEIQSYRDKLIY